jgi:hypothetical protein
VDPSGLRGRRPDLLAGAAVALLSLAGVSLVMRLWHADFGVPFAYSGDGNLVLMIVKGTLQHGWYLSNHDLGAPFGQQLQDYPQASDDTLHLLIVKFLGLFTGNYAVVVNLYFVLGFALVGISAFATLRVLGLTRPPAVVCAVLFTLLPYHFLVGEAAPFHSSYWVIPPACYLLLRILEGGTLFSRAEHPRQRLLAWASRRSLVTLLLCVVVGSAGSNYYSLFAVMLAVLAGLLALLLTRKAGALVAGLVVAAAIGAAVAANALPTLIYHAEHGSNPSVAKRQPQESEQFSLSIAQLVLPVSGHRIAPLGRLRDRYFEHSPTPAAASGPGLGLVGAAGFLWLLGFALAATIGAVRRRGPPSLHGPASAITLLALLIGTTGGFSILFAYLVSAQIRVWERLYLFIGFLALLAVGLLLDAAIRRIGKGRRELGVAGGLALLLLLGALDQTSNSDAHFVPHFSQTEASYRSDGDFVKEIERRLPAGASIFQLPYVPFPEWSPTGATQPFDSVRGYLHSDHLRWSYGAMFDRPADWDAAVVDKPLGLVLPSVAASGFSGIWIDRYAYPGDAAAIERGLEAALREAPLVSSDGRFSFFDLRRYARRLAATRSAAQIAALRDATLTPLRAAPGDGLSRYAPPGAAFIPAFQLDSSSGQLELINPSSTPRRAALRISLGGEPSGLLSVTLPGAGTRLLSARRPLEQRLTLPPGTSVVPVTVKRPAQPGEAIVLVTELRSAALDPFRSEPLALGRLAAQPPVTFGAPAPAATSSPSGLSAGTP